MHLIHCANIVLPTLDKQIKCLYWTNGRLAISQFVWNDTRIENSRQILLEAHGPHRSPENQFKSINTFDCIISLIRRKYQLFSLWELNGSSLEQLESPSPKAALCQVWLKLAQWFWWWRFFNFVHLFLLFRNYLTLEMGVALHLNNFESPQPKDALCQVWLKMAQ